ncbi:MAG: hypothetical protein KatS3mg040_0114 [Candidatus Kapaibacterium sp.]|nr:MAG: hypothetical protein KatS3mg040_0114 [Candidatus Kapabacteria bacterium]
MTPRKKLIEVALPLPWINDASAYDKMPGIGAHPKGIHHWWARLPLPVARAVLFASVVDDPSSHPEKFPTVEAQERERERLFGILRKMMQPRLHEHPEVYAEARAEMLKYCDGHLSPVLDPFAGGGSIPLEAARLGMEAYAGDQNPVAVLLNKCYLEVVPRWTDWPPVNPEATFLGTRAPRPHPTPTHKGWHSRGFIPHLDEPDRVQFITFRLHDSVPAEVIIRWRDELRVADGVAADDPRMVELRRRIEAYEDAGKGMCYLRDERIAKVVQDALLHFDGERYRLLAWCIMPNHVHVLIETLPGHRLSDIVHSWKSFTANEANRLLGRTGAFWQREYFDRFIRDETHLRATIEYIENNPVKAGLVRSASEWRFSSASASGSAATGSAAFQAAQAAPIISGKDAGAPSASNVSGKDAGAPSSPRWRGAAGLATDVRYYGRVILQRAQERIGHLYPPVKVTAEMAAEHPHLKAYVGRELPVIAWIWARTVPSPNPAARGAHVPLMSTFWLSSKKESEAWLEPVIERTGSTAGSAAFQAASNISGNDAGAPSASSISGNDAGAPSASSISGNDAGAPSAPRWRFRVRTGPPPDREAVKAGTKTGRAQFRCLLTGDPITDDYIKAQGQAGRMHARLVAIVADTGRGRVYLPATEEQEAVARKAHPAWKPEEPLQEKAADQLPLYGMSRYFQLFTPRQRTALVTLSDLIREVRADVRRDAASAGLQPAEADAYADAVATFLALALDRCADFNCALSTWKPSGQQQMHLFGRQAIPMVWDFAEANLLGEKAICWVNAVDILADAVETLDARTTGHARPVDAAQPWDGLKNVLVSTDPPYYDNIGYAALSDFFYVWLRRTIGDLYPELFGTILVPKEPELVAAPERFGGDKRKAKEHFEQGFRRAFAILREKMDPRFPLTVYYAFKQDDAESGADEDAGNAGVSPAIEECDQDGRAPRSAPRSASRIDRTTGWETMLTALIETGFQITATWPVRASQRWRMNAMEANALASYIVIACRPRPGDAPGTDRRSFVAELKRELPMALRHLQQGNIAPVDFAQAAIGPGMAIFSKYSKVLEASGRPMSVRTALALINQTLTEVLSEQEDEFDADTRWAIAWYEQHGFEEGEFGDAELLSKAKVTTVVGLVEGGIVVSRGGKVRLLRPEELPDDWNPDKDRRISVWEVTHHLVKVYWTQQKGERATADLLRRLGSRADYARELAYRLFSIAEKKGRSADAQGYNALVLGWGELAKLAQEQASYKQAELFSTEN